MGTMLINGNALSIPLADNSVHCVVTSPPYWGLRDYGTASWQGGDADCDHNPQRPDGGQRADRLLPLGRGGIYHNACGKCGAVRVDAQLGLEPTPEEYVAHMVEVFREVKRVLRPDGTCWLNIGDSYNANTGSGFNGQKRYDDANRNTKMPIPPGLKPKDLVGIPWMVAFALRADGWWLRSDIIWHKPNPMPESVTDRPTKAHEYMFLLTKSANYFYDSDAIREDALYGEHHAKYQGTYTRYKIEEMRKNGAPNGEQYQQGLTRPAVNPYGRNRRTVWTIATAPYSGAHFATFPPALVEPCVKAGTSERGCCPQCGAPWERVVERIPGERAETLNPSRIAIGHTASPRGYSSHQPGWRKLKPDIFDTGWRPTCQHDLDPVPATVFDPFAGSGTTLLVARQLGRNGVGLDLSMPYLRDQARDRLSMIALDEWTHGKKDGASVADLPMFRGAT